MSRNLPLALATVLGLASAANGLFILISPANWYVAVPGVTTTAHSTSISSATSV